MREEIRFVFTSIYFSDFVFQDFEKAYEALMRAGYNGIHGKFQVPEHEKNEAIKLYNLVKTADRGLCGIEEKCLGFEMFLFT